MGLNAFLAEYGGQAFKLPAIAGTYGGKSIAVCGDAACIWEDLERLGCRVNHRRGCVGGPFDFLTINKLVETFPGNIEHAYSNEPHLLVKFIAARRFEYVKEFNGPRNTHACNAGAKWHWPFGGHATSALGATLVAVGLGYDRVFLCGVPLEDGPHNGEPPWRTTTFTREAADSGAAGINRHWQRARDLAFDGKVRSMSGRTKQWLGGP